MIACAHHQVASEVGMNNNLASNLVEMADDIGNRSLCQELVGKNALSQNTHRSIVCIEHIPVCILCSFNKAVNYRFLVNCHQFFSS